MYDAITVLPSIPKEKKKKKKKIWYINLRK